MKEVKSNIQDVVVFCPYPKHAVLIDRRYKTCGIIFGALENVARQYGIKMEELPFGGVKLSAPKYRMQIFVEKLHFSGFPYREIV